MKRKIVTLTLGLAAAGLISAPLAAAAPGDNASANGKSISENVKAGGAAAQKAVDKAAERAAKAADETRASVGKAVSEAAKGGGGSVAVLTVLSELKPNNQGIAKALANALAQLNPVDPVDPVDPVPTP
jgi:hypothetical protein